MSTRLKYEVEYDVPDDTITDMLDAAGYGIGYWALSLEIQAVGSAQRIEVTEHDGTVHKVLYAQLRHAFGELVDPAQEHVGSTIHGYFIAAVTDRDENDVIDAGHIDSDAADAWVQVACLGEVRYG